MSWRPYWEALRRWYNARAPREQLLVRVGLVAWGLVALYFFVVAPVVAFRQRLAQEIADGQDRLEQDARFIARLESLERERNDLEKRLEREKAKLLSGDSPTLAAASLQERANAIATEKGITVQSTQVMRDEVTEPFRKVSVRLTLSGELKPFAEFLKDLEYAPDQQLAIPFIEITRRGAVPGGKGPRTLSGTVEVSGYLLAAAKPPAPAEGEGAPAEGETPPAAGEGEPAPEGEIQPPAVPPPTPPAGGPPPTPPPAAPPNTATPRPSPPPAAATGLLEPPRATPAPSDQPRPAPATVP
ncbi:MAG TPA: type II secretion system protein GspM [Candidatus Binatia bacterium]|nr:type II secretion system protein GspM [Candidatus Binatia bacterium]